MRLRAFQAAWCGILAASLAGFTGACASDPAVAKVFQEPANRLTAEEGRWLVDDGERMAEDADAQIRRGESLVAQGEGILEEGRRRRTIAEGRIKRGRQALRAAAMAEEAVRLQQRADELREDALE